MNRYFKLFLFSSFVVTISCNKEKEIRRLLNSKKPTEEIEGACEAGKSGDKKYVPLLLRNADDPSASTSLRYKGYTVYTETMFALEDILHVKPPHSYGHILESPDSGNIKFYSVLWKNMNKGK